MSEATECFDRACTRLHTEPDDRGVRWHIPGSDPVEWLEGQKRISQAVTREELKFLEDNIFTPVEVLGEVPPSDVDWTPPKEWESRKKVDDLYARPDPEPFDPMALIASATYEGRERRWWERASDWLDDLSLEQYRAVAVGFCLGVAMVVLAALWVAS